MFFNRKIASKMWPAGQVVLSDMSSSSSQSSNLPAYDTVEERGFGGAVSTSAATHTL